MHWKCNFTYKHYLEVLNFAKSQYSIGRIKDFSRLKNKKFLILRHDIDYSLDAALTIAKLEAENDLFSTYFILLHSQYYNALSPHNTQTIKKIYSLGHEIGLHYDSTFVNSNDKILDMVIQEVQILGNLIDYKISSIAPHNVSLANMRITYDHVNFIDATDPKILRSVKYISDSVQNWRSGCMCNHIDNESKLIILTHPIWWMKNHTSREEILAKFEINQIATIKKLLNETKQAHLSYFDKLETGKIS